MLYFDDLEQYYTEMEHNIITVEAQRYIEDNRISNELYDTVCEWLINNSNMEPNFLDYSESELNKIML